MKMYYFVDKEGVRQGPLPLEDLKAYDILPNTLVWSKGMEKWQKAKDIPEIASILSDAHENTNHNDDATIKKDSCEDNASTSDTSESDTSESDTSESDTPESDTPESDTPESDTHTANSGIGDNIGRKSGSKNLTWLIIGLLFLIVTVIGLWFNYNAKMRYERRLSVERALYEQTKENEAREAQEAAATQYSNRGESSYNSSSYPDRVRVTGVHVRFRTSPSISDDNIVKYKNGQTVYPDKGEILECVGETSEFYQVKYAGYTFYISKQFTEPY